MPFVVPSALPLPHSPLPARASAPTFVHAANRRGLGAVSGVARQQNPPWENRMRTFGLGRALSFGGRVGSIWAGMRWRCRAQPSGFVWLLVPNGPFFQPHPSWSSALDGVHWGDLWALGRVLSVFHL